MIRLLLEYDGTPFLGWQLQPQGPTVQGALEAALLRMTGEGVRVKGSGRTDAGVHALGQVASFSTRSRLEPVAIQRALNALLPPAVAVLAAREAPPGFDAQFSATGKTYRYRMLARREPSPLERLRAWHLPAPLDLDRVREAAALLPGRRDFSAFRGSGCVASSPVRTLARCDVGAAGGLIVFELEADGFLRHMVRNIVGTLAEVGRGRFAPAEVAVMLASRDRRRAGVAAPPHGLYLERVAYPAALGGWGAPPHAGSPALCT
jgi:tRNA pseudouridine38-40 synthase